MDDKFIHAATADYEALYKDWNADVKASYWEPGCQFCGLFDYNLVNQTHDEWEIGEFKKYVEERYRLTEDEEDLWLMVKEYVDDDDESDEESDEDDE